MSDSQRARSVKVLAFITKDQKKTPSWVMAQLMEVFESEDIVEFINQIHQMVVTTDKMIDAWDCYNEIQANLTKMEKLLPEAN